MRLFMALVPPPELHERLSTLADAAHARCGGRRMPDESLHLTLAFLGEVGDDLAGELAEEVCSLAVPAGRWTLDAWGHFRRPGIVWVGGSRPDAALQRLHERLWARLEGRGIPGRPSRFIPHVTLLRRAERLEADDLPDVDLEWTYNQVTLIHSINDGQDVRYAPLARSQAA
ncbi:MAG: RNA 2',3'-cyclic phosphodiesterase [Halomonas sp.]|uniref:RNA 2',3'-cyclic phosphodiesterase n=1 Tax=Halomonas sp. TaxID=1486246 RepID=UPI0019ED7754|nr:RNA 2',3'-cyclic phosphodiesterase [Halomonas sp.]MBE0488535.1 RNA 2',3'-cyclic phosphodiesterase [Halomonas sp.]